jgi:hypothetical protein
MVIFVFLSETDFRFLVELEKAKKAQSLEIQQNKKAD